MIVVADTSPVNYLLLIDHIDLLPRLYGRVVIPTSVASELSDADAPAVVKSWIESRPDWIDISEAITQNHSLDFLDRGERDGIALAQAIHADVILLDDLEARREAQLRKLYVTGTLECSATHPKMAGSTLEKRLRNCEPPIFECRLL